MGTLLEVEVLPEAGHGDGSEVQGRKGDRPSEESTSELMSRRTHGLRPTAFGASHDTPKPSGGTRTLGIPTVLDRFIRQALLQALIYDRTFSDHSHGFRPGRSAHGAVKTAQRYIQKGRRCVVDIDLEKFFDRANHDVLMGRLAKRTRDRRTLRVFEHSKKAGERVMRLLVKRFENLHLTVNAWDGRATSVSLGRPESSEIWRSGSVIELGRSTPLEMGRCV